jgi:integrase/recombinase XerD
MTFNTCLGGWVISPEEYCLKASATASTASFALRTSSKSLPERKSKYYSPLYLNSLFSTLKLVGRIRLGKPPRDGDPLLSFIGNLRIAGAGEGTVRLYSTAVRLFLKEVGKDPRDVGEDEVNWWIQKLYSSGERPSTIRSYTVAVRRFLEWLGKEVQTPVPRPRTAEVRALTEEEALNLKRSCLSLKEKAIINLLLDTGIRSKELLSLTAEDIDLHNRVVKVRETKNGEVRAVFFSEETKEILGEYLRGRKGRVFDMTYQGLYKLVRRIGRRAGVPVRPHVLRHTFATMALRRRMPLIALQRLMGHRDVKTTQVYTHLILEDLKRIYDESFGSLHALDQSTH